jgi:hypothetical protein
MSVDLPLAGVPRTCRVSESVENIQRRKNTRIKECFLSLSYNAETVSLRKADVADADVSKENTGMDGTHMRVGRAAAQRDLMKVVADLAHLAGGG